MNLLTGNRQGTCKDYPWEDTVNETDCYSNCDRENEIQLLNNDRSSLLPVLLSKHPPNAAKVVEVMRDRFHRPNRQSLVPGLAETVDNMRPSPYPGLLPVCMSGAAPTILELATEHFEDMAWAIVSILTRYSSLRRDGALVE